jgi:hypothetical protein
VRFQKIDLVPALITLVHQMAGGFEQRIDGLQLVHYKGDLHILPLKDLHILPLKIDESRSPAVLILARLLAGHASSPPLRARTAADIRT